MNLLLLNHARVDSDQTTIYCVYIDQSRVDSDQTRIDSRYSPDWFWCPDSKCLLLLAVTLMDTRLSTPERPIESIDGYVAVILPVLIVY